jgi:lipid-A-disaccharide synthase
MSKALRFGIVAGESSGDNLGAGLIRALRAHYPNAEFVGIAGPEMLKLGCRTLAPLDRLSVMGFVEPLGRLPELFRIKRQLHSEFVANPPAAFIGIDTPAFNLRLEEPLRQHAVKTVQYVSPSVWAHGKNRIHKIKRVVDLMLTLFPFETAIYEEHGIAVECVGHPLADSIGFEDQKAESRAQLDLALADEVVALMPGSRGGEIKRLGPVFFAAAVEALQHCPQLKFIIPCSSASARSQITGLLRSASIFPGDQFVLVDDSHQAISAADFVVLASGTATLETMLLRRPMVVCYKLGALTYAIGSRIVKIPNVALPNLLAGKRLVPEFLQNEVTIERVRDEIVSFMAGQTNHEALLDEFDAIHRSIRLDASSRAAEAILRLLDLPINPDRG